MLELVSVCKSYPGHPKKEVLREIDFSLQPHETTALMGVSGSGKTTFARVLLGLERADSGKVMWNGAQVHMNSRREALTFRRKVQYISQHPESFFDPFWTLKKSVYEAGKIHAIPRDSIDAKLPELLEQVKITPATLERYPYQVSGGEIQRISLCRSLLLEPEVLVLDEATSMLDISVQAQILHLLRDLKNRFDLTYLLISHEQSIVDWMADSVYTIGGGSLTRRK